MILPQILNIFAGNAIPENTNIIPNINKDKDESNSGDDNSGATYKCLFCNHIFKSHYCYQKHKRRHLNPFTVDFRDELTLHQKIKISILNLLFQKK